MQDLIADFDRWQRDHDRLCLDVVDFLSRSAKLSVRYTLAATKAENTAAALRLTALARCVGAFATEPSLSRFATYAREVADFTG